MQDFTFEDTGVLLNVKDIWASYKLRDESKMSFMK